MKLIIIVGYLPDVDVYALQIRVIDTNKKEFKSYLKKLDSNIPCGLFKKSCDHLKVEFKDNLRDETFDGFSPFSGVRFTLKGIQENDIDNFMEKIANRFIKPKPSN